MKIGVFSSVFGKKERFEKACEQYNGELELVQLDFDGTDANVDKIKNFEMILCTPGRIFSKDSWKTMAENGVKYVLTCSAGFDHLNIDAMREYGIKSANVSTYSPNSVAEHAIMLTLTVLRRYKEQIHMIDNGEYKIPKIIGKEIRKQKIAIVGAGRIGLTTMKCLSGFEGVEIFAVDGYENDEVRKYAKYVSLDEAYRNSDVIIYHCNLSDENYHMVNDEAIEKMKDGVCLINVARGGIFDTKAILKGMKSGKLGGVGLDVMEEEPSLNRGDKVPEFEELIKFENFVFTMHTAFYTQTANEDMAEITMKNAYEYKTMGECKNELTK